MMNDCLVPIVTSYRVVVIDRSGGGSLARSSDNPSTCFSKRYSNYGGLYQTLPELYIGNRKGVGTVQNKAILEYPIQLIQIQCKVMWMLFMKILQLAQDSIEYLL